MVQINQVFEFITQQAGKAIFLYHIKHQRFDYLSPNLREWWNIELESLPANWESFFNCIAREDQAFVHEMAIQLFQEAFSDKIDFSIVHQDSSRRNLSCKATSVNGQDGKVEWIGGIMQDDTELKKYEKTLYDYSARKNSLLEVLEHDLGGYLSMLTSIANSLTEEAATDPAKIAASAKRVQELCKGSMDLIADLVGKELHDSSEVPLKVDRVQIVDRIKSLFPILKASGSLISKVFTINASSPQIFLELDDVKFMQVINNLVHNAVKFTREDGHIHVEIIEKEDTVLFEVKDNGIGIPDHLKPFILEGIGGRKGTKGEKTSGVGLTIVKKMVEFHHGRFWFESTEGIGTSFFVELPKLQPKNDS